MLQQVIIHDNEEKGSPLGEPLMPHTPENQSDQKGEKFSAGWLQSVEIIQTYLQARSDIIYSKTLFFLDRKSALLISGSEVAIGTTTLILGIIKQATGFWAMGCSWFGLIPFQFLADRLNKAYKFRNVCNQPYPHRPYPNGLPFGREIFSEMPPPSADPELWWELNSDILADEIKKLEEKGFLTLDPQESIKTLLQKLIVASPTYEEPFGKSLTAVLEGMGKQGLFRDQPPCLHILEYALEDQALANTLAKTSSL